MAHSGGASEGWLAADGDESVPDGFEEYVSGGQVNTDLLGWAGCSPCVAGWRICYGSYQDLEKQWDRCYDCKQLDRAGKLWLCPC
jgi:hypothetical protein